MWVRVLTILVVLNVVSLHCCKTSNHSDVEDVVNLETSENKNIINDTLLIDYEDKINILKSRQRTRRDSMGELLEIYQDLTAMKSMLNVDDDTVEVSPGKIGGKSLENDETPIALIPNQKEEDLRDICEREYDGISEAEMGKTQIDCSQKSKYPCNALKRRLDTSEDMEKDNQLIKKVELFELSCKVLEIASTILENALKLNSFSKC